MKERHVLGAIGEYVDEVNPLTPALLGMDTSLWKAVKPMVLKALKIDDTESHFKQEVVNRFVALGTNLACPITISYITHIVHRIHSGEEMTKAASRRYQVLSSSAIALDMLSNVTLFVGLFPVKIGMQVVAPGVGQILNRLTPMQKAQTS